MITSENVSIDQGNPVLYPTRFCQALSDKFIYAKIYVFIVRETISFRLILLFPLWNHQHHSLLNSFLKFAQLQLEALNSNFQQKTDYINLKRVWSFPINWNVLVFQKVFIHVLVVYRRGRQEALREITLFYALDLTHSKLN